MFMASHIPRLIETIIIEFNVPTQGNGFISIVVKYPMLYSADIGVHISNGVIIPHTCARGKVISSAIVVIIVHTKSPYLDICVS